MASHKPLFFAALVPPPMVKQEVKEIKLEIKDKFGAAHALKLPAHVTLIPPLRLEKEQEEPFLKALENVVEKQFPFPVKLKDFGHFGQRVIFLKVVDHKPVKELHQRLLQAINGFLPLVKNQNLHPHVTLATRDLSRENFYSAWQEMKDRKYEAQFVAAALTLFKNDGKSWNLFKIFNFSGRSSE